MTRTRRPHSLQKSEKAFHSGPLERPTYREISVSILQSAIFCFPGVAERMARVSERTSQKRLIFTDSCTTLIHYEPLREPKRLYDVNTPRDFLGFRGVSIYSGYFP